MNSDTAIQIESLLVRTEANIKLVQEFGRSFLCVVLNEWRYATRHIVNVMLRPNDEEELRKAMSHLRRAYYDSCDVLIDCLLQRIFDYQQAYAGYAGVVAALVPDFNKYNLQTREAQDAHRKAKSCPPDMREKSYESLAPYVENLLKFMATLEATKDSWLEDVRKQKNRDRLLVMTVAVSVFGAALAVLLKFI